MRGDWSERSGSLLTGGSEENSWRRSDKHRENESRHDPRFLAQV